MKRLVLSAIVLTIVICSCNKDDKPISENTEGDGNILVDSAFYYSYSAAEDSALCATEYFIYDSDGNKIKYTHCYYGTHISPFRGDSQIEYEYNSFGSITQEISYTRWANSDEWIVNSKVKYTYNTNNKLLIMEYYGTKYEYTLNSSDVIVSLAIYKRNVTENKWDNSSKYDYTINEKGFQTASMKYTWDSTSKTFELYAKTEDITDDFGNIILSLHYDYDADNKLWVDKNKYVNTYDSKSNLTSEEYFDCYDGIYESHGWLKYNFEYDVFGNLLSKTRYDQNSGSLYISSRIEKTYDAKGNLIAIEGASGEPSSQDLLTNYFSEFIYNSKGTEINQIHYNTVNSTLERVGNTYYFISKHPGISLNKSPLDFLDLL